MSDIAAPVSAPAAAPSAPTSAPSTQTLGVPPTAAGNAPSPPSGEQAPQAPPPKRDPIPWKTKHRIGEEEMELELDVSPFFETYKRKVKVDGREFEVPIEEAYKNYERFNASRGRFEEAAKLRREVEAKETQLAERTKRIEAALTDPRQALSIVKRTLGEDAYLAAITAEIRQRLEYEQLPPEQRQLRDQMTEAERKVADREQALTKRQRELEAREQQIKLAEEQRLNAAAQQRQQALVAEWVPMLEAAGLPAKIEGKPNMRIVRMVAETMQSAKRAGMPMTVQEAISEVRAEYEAMVGHTVQQRQQQAMQAASEQPGRADSVLTTRPVSSPKRYEATEDFERTLQSSWQRRR